MAYSLFWDTVFLAEAVVTLFLWCQFLYTNVKLYTSWSTSVATMRKKIYWFACSRGIGDICLFCWELTDCCLCQLPYWRYRCQVAMPVSLCLFCSVRSRTACRKTVCLLSDCLFSFLCICKFLSGTEVGPLSAVYSCARQGWLTYIPFGHRTFVTEISI